MFARKIIITFIFYFMISLVESMDCNCITNAINQERCPGSGITGYFSVYGHCRSYENWASGCFCKECSSCDD